MDEKVREQRRGPARASFLCTALISGPCDVEMRPFEPLGELGQECRGCDGTTVTPADIREISEVALQLFGVLFGERQLPCPVICAYTSLHELLHIRMPHERNLRSQIRLLSQFAGKFQSPGCRRLFEHIEVDAQRFRAIAG